MGVYYRWLCDERREYFDPGEILGPGCCGYGVKAGSIPYSAWVVGALMTERWEGCRVRLVGDGVDDYNCDGYEEVSQHVLRELTRSAPDEALWFLAAEVCRVRGKTVGFNRMDGEKRGEYLKILEDHAREDWPPRCGEQDCLRRGSRHPGDHVSAPPVPEPEYVRRQYCVGLGSAEVGPGEEVSLGAETTCDFYVDRLVLAEDIRCFTVLRISAAGSEVLAATGVNAFVFGSEGLLPLHHEVKIGQKIEVVLRNNSDSRAKIAGGVFGSVVEKNSRWLSGGRS